MNIEPAYALEGVLRELYPEAAHPDLVPEREPDQNGALADRRHRKWFATFAVQAVMPMLNHAAADLQHRGLAANARLLRNDEDEVIAELVIVPSRLPGSAAPPRLLIGAATGPHGLALTTSGVHPNHAAVTGFAAEFRFETVYTSDLKHHVADFVALATGL